MDMKRIRERKSWIVLIAVLLLFAACKGESPTAPPPGGSPPGGSPPPTGVNLVLTATNTNPLVDSSVTITATVTDNGQPVPNGTAVEFSSSAGVLNSGGTSVIKTTTNGIATVTLTTGTSGLIRVTAIVNNVVRTIDITFKARDTTPQPPNTAPTITSITPNLGKPAGGQIIHITGTNFKPPVKVLFRIPNQPVPVEGSVVAVTDTSIDVVTPPVNLGAGQQLIADVIVFTQAGTASEQSVEASAGFTYRNEQLTPIIHTVSPNSGPVTGGTRVTIFGEGFQDPVQVLFDTAEARVLNVQFGQILVESPAGRDTSPDGSGPVLGPVTVLVRNINSNTSGSMAAAFAYKAAMQITAVGPTQGPPTGGTRVTIDGNGFVSPVAVSIGGIAAQPVFVSGTRVIALTGAADIEGCSDVQGPVAVTNINNGDSATAGVQFTFKVTKPVIVAVTPSSTTPGGVVTVRVFSAGLFPQLKLGDRGVTITGTTDNGDGTTSFTFTVPTNVTLDQQACPGGGTRDIDTSFDVTFTSLDTGCTTTSPDAVTVTPPNNGRLFFDPNPLNISATGDDPATVPDEEVDGSGTFSIINTGAAPLTITSIGSNNPNFTVSDPSGTTLAPCESVIVAVTYEAGPKGSADSAQITVNATTTSGVITARETVIGRTN